jgi:sporulation protein YlmC with PRC-barrel domain
MIRFSDIAGHPVMDTSTATSIGRIAAPVVDPVAQRVVAFRVKRSKGPGDVLLWDSIAGMGPDAITVGSADRLIDPPEELQARTGKKLDLIGRLVLTEHGHALGVVKDLEFDPASGAVTSVLLKDRHVDGARLLGIGSYAVVVRT